MQHILIVDSDKGRRSRLAFLLQHMGYAVDVHPGGTGRAARREPDLVLLSEHVLDAHADDVVPWMLASFGAPKVVLGNEPEEVAGVPYLEMGADAYLTAPLDLRMLLARVRAVLSRQQKAELEAVYAGVRLQTGREIPESSTVEEAM